MYNTTRKSNGYPYEKLYLVRHGETLFNKKYLMQGICDSPLTIKGHEQAKAVGEIFKEKGITFDHAYCSTLYRAEETLMDITDIPYERCAGIRERDYGMLEGESRRITEGLTTEQRNQLYTMFGVEATEPLKQRMAKALTDIMEKEDHQSVLCVAHGSINSYFLCYVDPDTELKRLKNGHVLEFEYDGTFHFVDAYYPENA